ncbi:hypothetical protein Tsubulata_029989 [Turnera subulata]|uniref:Protein kinase domain-containing protein n=1 Tax=Turnera subulata TaxID=218843 RepID=A0A9Q0FSC4_9ROSI|nr:hypothetical protein Tsubulata_029989 [Turnera subulata]
MGKENHSSCKSHAVSWIRGNCIGKGSFGTVSTAMDKQTGAVFAVKSSPLFGAPNHQARQSLENEIRILSSLSSPHIVKYLGDDVSYDSTTTTTPCRNLHMEYLPGGSVAELASSRADVDEKIVRSHTWCVASALNYLHSRGIVHCDVKGENILVGPHTGSAKLADFGSAVELGSTGATLPRGSPLWMAPEVIRGEYQGPESDVWSLGCTVIEMVTGKPAWEDRGVDTLSRIGFSQELPELPTQLSELGRDFVEKCLRRDRSERWSCDQLLQHPFISSSSPDMITESSPRCVLDWLTSDFEEEDDDDVPSLDCENYEVSAKDRIGRLATSTRADWETEGWVEVRSSTGETEEELGTSSAYSETTRIEHETVGTSTVYSAPVGIREGVKEKGRTELEFLNSGGSDYCLPLCVIDDGSTCRPRRQKQDRVTNIFSEGGHFGNKACGSACNMLVK